VNGYSSLKEPPGAFIDDEDEDEESINDDNELGISDDTWYSNAESEIFTLSLILG
jgi:hypothetical protein